MVNELDFKICYLHTRFSCDEIGLLVETVNELELKIYYLPTRFSCDEIGLLVYIE